MIRKNKLTSTSRIRYTLYALFGLLIIGCTQTQKVNCCSLSMSSEDMPFPDVVVCDYDGKNTIGQYDGAKALIFNEKEKYQCVCVDKKLDGIEITIPAGNYTEDEPFQFNIFGKCN